MSATTPSPLELNEALSARAQLAPSRKVFVLFTALQWAGERSADWQEAIERGLEMYHKAPLKSLSSLEEMGIDWDPFEVFSEILVSDFGAPSLRIVRKQLFRAGYQLSLPDLHDVSTAFINSRLSAAVHSFDPRVGEGKELPWLSTVLFRYSLRHAVEAGRLSPLLDVAENALPSEVHTPEEELDRIQRERLLRELRSALRDLREPEQRALELYFGFSGSEATISEVAKSLGTSSYYAKLTLASAIAGLATRLGATGLLTSQELRVADALRRMDEASASAHLDLPVEVVQRSAKDITRKISNIMRRRTVTRNTTEGEIVNNESDINRLVEDLRQHKFRIVAKPEMTYLLEGATFGTAYLARARELLAPQAEQLASSDPELEQAMIELYAPRVARRDFTEDEVRWLERIERANAASLEQIERFLESVPGLARSAYRPDEDRAHKSLAERVYDSLVSASTALEKMIPITERREGKGALVLSIRERGIYARNALDEEGESLQDLLAERMYRIGGFDAESARRLAVALTDALMQGAISMPQFTWRLSRGHSVELAWERLVLSKGE